MQYGFGQPFDDRSLSRLSDVVVVPVESDAKVESEPWEALSGEEPAAAAAPAVEEEAPVYSTMVTTEEGLDEADEAAAEEAAEEAAMVEFEFAEDDVAVKLADMADRAAKAAEDAAALKAEEAAEKAAIKAEKSKARKKKKAEEEAAGVVVPSVVDSELSSLTVAQLKEKLRAANLPVSGKKAELIARLS